MKDPRLKNITLALVIVATLIAIIKASTLGTILLVIALVLIVYDRSKE